jgi:lipoprotein-releasing system permease protein
MKGFQETVKNKIYNFSGHLIVTQFSMNNSPEEIPMDFKIDLYNNQKQFDFIDHVQEYAHKAGLVKTEKEVVGVVIKGVGKSFDQEAFAENIVEGRFIHFPDSNYSNEIVLSRTIMQLVDVSVGDDIIVHFFQNPPRFRKVILGDIRLIQRLNDWPDSIAGGLEVFVKDPSMVEEAGATIGEMMDYDLNIESVSDKYIQVFEWLDLLSRQVNILLGIILFVVCVNMISIVLILVMERTQMIGMLKALGAKDSFIRSIFFYNGVQLIIKGLFLGNIFALGACYLQDRFHIVKLNPKDYYMSFVPISWQWDIVLGLNILTFVIVALVLLLPTMVISRISPIKAIRFD